MMLMSSSWKITLYASVDWNEWKEKFRLKGLKAGEIGGQCDGEPAVLVQMEPFPYGSEPGAQYVVVEFRKAIGEVYLDMDEGNEAVEEGIIDADATTYAEVRDVRKLQGLTLYGSYVRDIKPEEIVAVHIGYWNPEDELPYVDGRIV